MLEDLFTYMPFITFIVSFLLGLLFYFIRNFDKNRYYFMPIYTPSASYFYPEWHDENGVTLTYNENNKSITLYGYSTKPIEQVLPSDIIILYYHGNAGNIYIRIPLFKEMVEKLNARYKNGQNRNNGNNDNNGATSIGDHVIIAFDYRGFGLSDGIPSSSGILEDGMQIWDWCHRKFTQNKIVLYGESIGTSVAAYVAMKTDPNGVILKSPFTSMHSLLADMLHLPGFLRNIPHWLIPHDFLTTKWLEKGKQARYQKDIEEFNANAIDNFNVNNFNDNTRNKSMDKTWDRDGNIPTVILYNKEDELIPTRNIKELLYKYRSFALEGGHNDCDIDIAWLNGCSHVLDKI